MHNNPMLRNKKIFPKALLLKALDHKFYEEDFADEEISMRKFFEILLTTLWIENDGFSGKRPFGNSCWEWQVFKPLVVGGFIAGNVNEYGDIDGVDKDEANLFVEAMIKEVFKK